MGSRKKILMYHGERASIYNNKICQLFKSKDGKEYKFLGIKRVYFGDCYPMLDNKMKIRPERVEGWEPTEKERQEYEAQKLVVRAERQARKKSMELRKPHPDIIRAVNLLRPFCRLLSDMDRNSFMRWVSNECSKKN